MRQIGPLHVISIIIIHQWVLCILTYVHFVVFVHTYIYIYIYMPDCLLHVCTEPLIALKLDNYHYQIARVEYIFTLR